MFVYEMFKGVRTRKNLNQNSRQAMMFENDYLIVSNAYVTVFDNF